MQSAQRNARCARSSGQVAMGPPSAVLSTSTGGPVPSQNSCCVPSEGGTLVGDEASGTAPPAAPSDPSIPPTPDASDKKTGTSVVPHEPAHTASASAANPADTRLRRVGRSIISPTL